MGRYSNRHGLVLGFHGCDRDVRDRVVNGQSKMAYSRNAYDWLGYGAYFWENNLTRALDFATNPPGKPKFECPSVLGAVMDLAFCLDMLDAENIALVKAAYTNAEQAFKNTNKVLPKNRKVGDSQDFTLRELDCTIIQNLHEIRYELGLQPFDSVRGMFAEGKPLYENAGFRDKDHIQICIRNPNCIKGLFIPLEEESWNDNHLLQPSTPMQAAPAIL